MQNLIAALSIPASGAETASAPPCGELGDSTFSDTFVEVASSTGPDDATSADIVVPFSWPLIISQKPAFMSATDAAVDTSSYLPSAAAVTGGATVPQVLSEAGPSFPALGPAPTLDAGKISTSRKVQTETTPPGFVGRELASDAEIGKGASPGVQALPSSETAISGGPFSLEPVTNTLVSHAPMVATASNLQVKVDRQVPDSPMRIAEGVPKSDAGAVISQISDDTVPVGDSPEPVRVPEIPLSGIPAKPDAAVHALERPSVEPTSGMHRAALEHRAIAGLKPALWQIDRMNESGGEAPTDSNSPTPVSGVVGLDLAADASTTLTAVPASLPSQEAVTDHRSPQSSFWERYYSDPAISAADNGRQPATGIASSATVPVSGPVVSPVLVETSGEVARKSPPPDTAASVSVTGTVPDQHYLSTPPKAATAPSADIFGKAFAGLVVSGWEEDLSGSDQGAEILQPLGQSHSARTATGSPLSSFPALPVPQVASQLASVLVHSANSMTELALAPEELGRVRLRMEPDAANPDRMVILISVERPETLDLFRRHASELAEAIRSAGYSGADIGFGQDSRDDRSEHKREASPAGTGLPFEETGHVEATRMLPVGASLDLRL